MMKLKCHGAYLVAPEPVLRSLRVGAPEIPSRSYRKTKPSLHTIHFNDLIML